MQVRIFYRTTEGGVSDAIPNDARDQLIIAFFQAAMKVRYPNLEVQAIPLPDEFAQDGASKS